MSNRTPWLITGIAVLWLLAGIIVNAQIEAPPVATAGPGSTGNSDALRQCRLLITSCDAAIKELDDCSKFLHAITLGAWCSSEATNAVATCTAAAEVCKIAK